MKNQNYIGKYVRGDLRTKIIYLFLVEKSLGGLDSEYHYESG